LAFGKVVSGIGPIVIQKGKEMSALFMEPFTDGFFVRFEPGRLQQFLVSPQPYGMGTHRGKLFDELFDLRLIPELLAAAVRAPTEFDLNLLIEMIGRVPEGARMSTRHPLAIYRRDGHRHSTDVPNVIWSLYIWFLIGRHENSIVAGSCTRRAGDRVVFPAQALRSRDRRKGKIGSLFGRKLCNTCPIPFLDRCSIMGGEIWIVIGANPGEMAESFQISAALQIALVSEKDETESGPTRIVVLICSLDRIQKLNELPQGQGRTEVCCGNQYSSTSLYLMREPTVRARKLITSLVVDSSSMRAISTSLRA
jgi:hypothetical protein